MRKKQRVNAIVTEKIRMALNCQKRGKMIKYTCKKCNVNTEVSLCPVCGERAELESSTIYWCDGCSIPLYDKVCPICGKKAYRIGSDLRPVCLEERLLLEIGR